jgi:N-acetyl-gamma-glutamyl-phosphate reductase
MLKVGVVGATGYTGEELIKILIRHTEVKLTLATSESSAGKKEKHSGLTLVKLSDAKIEKQCDLVFCCLPHRKAMQQIAIWRKSDLKVIDLSADFRLQDPVVYEKWYEKHLAPALLKESVYGLSEFHRGEIKKTSLVGNPGCYPTGASLGLIPLIQAGLIQTTGMVIDSKSGISGAGRPTVEGGLREKSRECVSAYKVGEHRHTPEIEQEISYHAKKQVTLTFTPHLMPMERGILSTIYTNPTKKMDTSTLLKTFNKVYEGEPFIKVLDEGSFPATKKVTGTNNCHVSARFDDRTNKVVIITAIDNLLKGASGQAVQNMNIMYRFEETAGLLF